MSTMSGYTTSVVSFPFHPLTICRHRQPKPVQNKKIKKFTANLFRRDIYLATGSCVRRPSAKTKKGSAETTGPYAQQCDVTTHRCVCHTRATRNTSREPWRVLRRTRTTIVLRCCASLALLAAKQAAVSKAPNKAVTSGM